MSQVHLFHDSYSNAAVLKDIFFPPTNSPPVATSQVAPDYTPSLHSVNDSSGTSIHVATVVHPQDHEQSDHDFYQDRWFCKLILLWYLLTLEIAGKALYRFPLFRFSHKLSATLTSLAPVYASWLLVDYSIVFVFTFVSLCLVDMKSSLPVLPPWLVSPAWYGIIAFLMGIKTTPAALFDFRF